RAQQPVRWLAGEDIAGCLCLAGQPLELGPLPCSCRLVHRQEKEARLVEASPAVAAEMDYLVAAPCRAAEEEQSLGGHRVAAALLPKSRVRPARNGVRFLPPGEIGEQLPVTGIWLARGVDEALQLSQRPAGVADRPTQTRHPDGVGQAGAEPSFHLRPGGEGVGEVAPSFLRLGEALPGGRGAGMNGGVALENERGAPRRAAAVERIRQLGERRRG